MIYYGIIVSFHFIFHIIRSNLSWITKNILRI